MRIMTVGTQVALIGAALIIGYGALRGSGVSFSGKPEVWAANSVMQSETKLEKKPNAAGELELYLGYSGNGQRSSLPITRGPNGPVVGSAEYNWSSMDAATKSVLVGKDWGSLEAEMRKSILKGELEEMLENYGGRENGKGN